MTTNIADLRGMSTKFFGRNNLGVDSRLAMMFFRGIWRDRQRGAAFVFEGGKGVKIERELQILH